jgi:2-oxo-hept-3-ene-1,7-dioate hydratase
MLTDEQIQPWPPSCTPAKRRAQLEHFSKRFPGMTVEDGYRIGRAWVALQRAEGRRSSATRSA